jgi:hypothetical protein
VQLFPEVAPTHIGWGVIECFGTLMGKGHAWIVEKAGTLKEFYIHLPGAPACTIDIEEERAERSTL